MTRGYVQEDAVLYRPTIMSGDKKAVHREAISDNVQITVNHAPYLFLDPGGSGKDVRLPNVNVSAGLAFCIINTEDSSGDLTVKTHDEGVTVGTVAMGGAAFFFCDGSSWFGFPIDTGSFSGTNGALSGTLSVGGVATLPLITETAQARTATALGDGTGQIAVGTRVVTVTSGNADHIITLPAPTVGHKIRITNPGQQFELRTSTPASIGINGGVEAGAESAIAATDVLLELTAVSATNWVGIAYAADGTITEIDVAAAA